MRPAAGTSSARRRTACVAAARWRPAPRRRRSAGAAATDAPASSAAVEADAQTVHVEERQRQDEPVVGLPAPGDRHGARAREQVAVAEHRALRRAGRARRVGEHREVAGRGLVERRRAGRGVQLHGCGDDDRQAAGDPLLIVRSTRSAATSAARRPSAGRTGSTWSSTSGPTTTRASTWTSTSGCST